MSTVRACADEAPVVVPADRTSKLALEAMRIDAIAGHDLDAYIAWWIGDTRQIADDIASRLQVQP